jgi:ankyrin repeat protein
MAEEQSTPMSKRPASAIDDDDDDYDSGIGERMALGDPTMELVSYLNRKISEEGGRCDAARILVLLESGADPSAYRSRWGDTILHSISNWFSSIGDDLVGILDMIVSQCDSLINIPDDYNIFPISKASRSHSRGDTHRIAILKILIKYGADVNVTDSGGLSPLDIAVNGVDRLMFDLLLANGANPNGGGVNPHSGAQSHPIEGAVFRRNVYMVSRLLDLNINLDFIAEGNRPMLQVGMNHPDYGIQMCFVNWLSKTERG